jgi:hypothetical protein
MKKIKVSQKTIDQIKNLGMTKALAAGKTVKSAEFQEGLRRMYGAKRLAKATGSTARSTQPVGGVMGTKRAQVMSGPVRSTKKVSPEAKTVKAFNSNDGVRLQSSNAVQQALAARAPKPRASKPVVANTSFSQTNKAAQAAYKAKQAAKQSAPKKKPTSYSAGEMKRWSFNK